MIELSATQIWSTIVILGVGTFLVRFSFLGLLGDRPLPDWALRHLRYTAVSVLPALIAPLVIWPQASNGELDPVRLAAAMAALAVGYIFRSSIGAMVAGFAVLYALIFLT